MIGGILIQNKKYKMLDFSAAFLMTIGLIFFTLADVSVSPQFDYRGVGLITLALIADAAIGNVQEKTMKTLKASNVEIIFYSYSIGSVYLFLGLLVTNEIWAPFSYAMENLDVYYRILVFSFSGYIGLQFVLALVRIFGAYIAITVTTCRKALSIIISFMFFTKPFTMQYVWSGMIVVSGIALSVYSKNSKGSSVNLGDKIHRVIAWFMNRQNGVNASSDMPNRKKYQELRMENV
jgi:adenosine 3'-phospho 5'-phosphosulfate transporter B3